MIDLAKIENKFKNAIKELEAYEKGNKKIPVKKRLKLAEKYMNIGCASDKYIQKVFNIIPNQTSIIRKKIKDSDD